MSVGLFSSKPFFFLLAISSNRSHMGQHRHKYFTMYTIRILPYNMIQFFSFQSFSLETLIVCSLVKLFIWVLERRPSPNKNYLLVIAIRPTDSIYQGTCKTYFFILNPIISHQIILLQDLIKSKYNYSYHTIRKFFNKILLERRTAHLLPWKMETRSFNSMRR